MRRRWNARVTESPHSRRIIVAADANDQGSSYLCDALRIHSSAVAAGFAARFDIRAHEYTRSNCRHLID